MNIACNYHTHIRNLPIRSQLYCDKSWYPTISSHWPDIPRYHGHFQVKWCYRTIDSNKKTCNLRFSWCFAVERRRKKRSAKTKLEDARHLKHSDNGVGVAKFFAEFGFWEFRKWKLQVKELKRCQKRNFITSFEDQKSIKTSRSTQFALRTWQT